MIHPTAIIDPRAEIGADVEIGPYTVIAGPVRIGPGSRIFGHAWLTGETVLGAKTIVHPFCCIGDLPQDFSFDREKTRSGLTVGDGCEFREYVTLHRGTGEGGQTRIGNGVYLMAYSHIGHDCRIGDHVTMANSAQIAGHVEVGNNAFVSGNVSVHQHVHIGSLAMVGASSFVSQDVPPCCTVQGVPARVAGMNIVGMRRNGYSQERRSAVKTFFRMLYREGLALEEACRRLEADGSADAALWRSFIAGSRRGIMAPRMRGGKHEDE